MICWWWYDIMLVLFVNIMVVLVVDYVLMIYYEKLPYGG